MREPYCAEKTAKSGYSVRIGGALNEAPRLGRLCIPGLQRSLRISILNVSKVILMRNRMRLPLGKRKKNEKCV